MYVFDFNKHCQWQSRDHHRQAHREGAAQQRAASELCQDRTLAPLLHGLCARVLFVFFAAGVLGLVGVGVFCDQRRLRSGEVHRGEFEGGVGGHEQEQEESAVRRGAERLRDEREHLEARARSRTRRGDAARGPLRTR